MRRRGAALFLKHPEPGRVKTRLAETLGAAEAAVAYQKLVREVIRLVRQSCPDVIYLFFDPPEQRPAIEQWLHPYLASVSAEIVYRAQSSGDLGQRLTAAVHSVYADDPATDLLVLGTDCIDIDATLLHTAWQNLEHSDVVLGPAEDGGYYLIGLSQPHDCLFQGIPWSTAHTLQATLDQAQRATLSYQLLKTLRDIDTMDEYSPIVPRLAPRPCVFFDRDGVINHSPGPGYVLHHSDFHIHDGIAEALSVVREAGYLAVVVTSQKGVGKGLMTQDDLDQIHHKLQTVLNAKGGGLAFDAIYSYTATPDCPHRAKPDPEMILTAASEHEIDLSRSWMIGDADRDIEMGIAAEVRGTIRVRGDKSINTTATHTIDEILYLPQLLRKLL